ncbi:hypothetical protein C7G42_15640 [Bradyrhizobium sp. MOS003]|jgi:hypothetical protein|nr:hypothetical protein C7G42_15640 [Bradyrhizobium sp. MOS003]
MENIGGTEVISRGRKVLFVAGLLPRELLHCNSRSRWRAARLMVVSVGSTGSPDAKIMAQRKSRPYGLPKS